MRQLYFNGDKRTRLCFVCSTIFTGKTPVYDYDSETYIIIGQKNNQGGKIILDGCKYAEKSFHDKNSKELFLKKGDIILNSLGGGSVGRIGYYDLNNDDVLTDGHPIVFRINRNNSSRYVFYALYNEQKQLEEMSVGSTNQCFLNISDVYHFEIPIYELNKQLLIADFLDKKCGEINGLIADIEKEIEILTQYKKSIITESVTMGLSKDVKLKNSGIEWAKHIPEHWEVIPNKYLMKKIKNICPKYTDEKILSLTMNGVIVRDLDAGGKMPTSFDGYQIVKPGNLLMCLFDIDVTPRCVGLIKDYGLTSPAYSQFVMKEKAYAPYYYYYYLMLDYTKELLHLAKNLRHSFTEEQLGTINTPVPPIQEQKEIAEYLDKKCKEIDSILEDKNKQLETLESYKKSIIYEYVTGKKEVSND